MSRDDIEIIKDKLDIVDIIGQTVSLKDHGFGIYKGATMPGSKSGQSLNVDRNQQIFNDWANNDAKGDVLNWIAYDNNLDIKTDFPRVLSIAAEMAGVTLEKSDIKHNEESNFIFTITTAIAQHYHSCLTDEHRQYITDGWGISNETIDRLDIGFAPVDESLIEVFDGLFQKEDLLKTGFLIKTADGIKPFYQGRIVFPYWKGGKVVYSIARKTEWTPDKQFEQSKYKKQLTKKENRQYVSELISNTHFYGEDSIRGKEYCIITEGVTDCIMGIQAGEPCISPVTVRFKKTEIEKAAQLVTGMKTVYICNDNDDAGNKGAMVTADYMDERGINVRIVELPDDKDDIKTDLAEYIKQYGDDGLSSLIKASKPLIVTKLDKIEVETESIDNIPTATEFIRSSLNGNDTPYKIAFIEINIKKHFGFSSKIISGLISEMKTDDKEKKAKDKIELSELTPIDDSVVVPEDVAEEARKIIFTGDPVKKIIETHAKLHVGDEPLARALLVSIGIQSVLNSDGIHPKVSGDSGKGKTHCCKTMMHLIPEKYKFNTTLSDRAIYYMDIPEGAVVFSDDIDLSETLEGIIKRSTSNFQEGDNYTTLDKNLDVKELYIPPRISWWLTSVDDDQSIQLLNRQFGGGVDESSGQDDAVFDFQRELMKTGVVGLPDNEDVAICRCIIDDIKKQLFNVVIPFADDMEWADKSNRRNFLIFGDILRAFAVLRHRQRYKTDNNQLIANIEDFNDARDLYIGRAKNQGTKLTDAELRFCNVLNQTGELDSNQLQRALGVSQGRISQIINGKGKGDSGLLHKVKGLVVEDRTVRDDNTSVKRLVYSLHGFDPFDNYETAITLKPGAEDRFLQYYPDITLTLPDKNITSITDITYITKYIIYTQGNKCNTVDGVRSHPLCVESEKQGNKVITGQPITNGGCNNGVLQRGKLPDDKVKPVTIKGNLQEKLHNHILEYKKVNHKNEVFIDPYEFVNGFVSAHTMYSSIASKVKAEVEQLNSVKWMVG